MHLPLTPTRVFRPPASRPLGALGRSLLPWFGLMLLAGATVFGAWLLLFLGNLGWQLVTHA